MNNDPTTTPVPISTTGTASATVPAGAILVWDAPLRVFHWLLAATFIGAFVSAESERWRLLHVTLGYTVGGLVVFRLLWGLLGTRHARFADFVRGPRAVLGYLRALIAGKAHHPVGHNPAGAVAIVALLAGAGLIAASGWAVYSDLGGGALEALHEGAANAMLGLVAVHVLAVVVSSRLQRENLVRAMVTGRKPGQAQDGIRRAWLSVAALMLVAVLGFWWQQWQTAPQQTAQHSMGQVHTGGATDDDDDD